MTETITGRRVRLRTNGAVAHLLLDAPHRHNALEHADVDALLGMLARLDDDEGVRALVLTGAGVETFCAGASLAEMESGAMNGAVFDSLTSRLAALRVPTVCALNGSVYGGGAELALCCDFRIGVRGSRLSVPAGRLGVCYPVGGLERYVQRLGLTTAMRILIAGEELDAEEMLRVGFLTFLVAPEDLPASSDALAQRLAEQAPLALQAMKRLLLEAASGAVDRKAAAALVERCAGSEDFEEGLRARREGRAPVFRGR